MDDQLKDMNLDDSLTERLDVGKELQNGAESSEKGAKSADKAVAEIREGRADASKLEEKPEKPEERPQIDVLSPAQKRSMQDREFSILLRTRGRALSQALMTIAGTRQRSGRLWLVCGATLVVISLLLIQVYYRHRDLNLGYELSEAISARESMLEENRKLRIELRVLSRRERLEQAAGQRLGMAAIRPDQVLIVHEKKVEVQDPGRRADGLDNVRRIGEQ